MRQPRRQQVGAPVSRPSPVGGWNARDSFADMEPTEATLLDNFFPTTSWVEVRKGSTIAYQGAVESGNWETFMEFDAGGNNHFLAAASTELWRLDSAPVAQLGTGYDNARWQYINFNEVLLAVNGADSIKYDGSTATANSITGPSAPIAIMGFHSRVYVFDDNSLSFWYGATNAISGSFTEFNLSRVTNLGGKLMCMGAWTKDGGDEGLQDFAVFVTSRGEAVIYQGSNPGDATAWALVGVYHIGEPLSVRSVQKMGGDMVVLTTNGYVSMNNVLGVGDVSDRGALSHKIRRAVTDAVAAYQANYGWQAIFQPKLNMAVFNVPTGTNTAEQHVMNTLTGSWSRFTGLDTAAWGRFNGGLYFNGPDIGILWDEGMWDEEDWASRGVFQYAGVSDNGQPIIAEGRTAYDYLGTPGQRKQWTAARPVLADTSGLSPILSVATDFSESFPDADIEFAAEDGLLWDTGEWDQWFWADDQDVSIGWFSLVGAGMAASTRLRLSTGGATTKWYSTDYIVKGAGIV